MAGRSIHAWVSAGTFAVVFAAMSAMAQQPIVVQSGQAGRDASAQRRYVSPWSGSLQWLSNPAVQKDLELIPDQVEKITTIRQELQEEMQRSYKEISSVPADQRQQRYYDMNVELADRTEKKLAEILLPEQQDRLQQISLQMRLRSYWGLGQQLTGEELAKKLGISEEQRDRLLKLQQELREEIQRKTREFYEKINAEAESKMFEALTAAQRRELQEMMGPRFEWAPWTPPAQGAPKK